MASVFSPFFGEILLSDLSLRSVLPLGRSQTLFFFTTSNPNPSFFLRRALPNPLYLLLRVIPNSLFFTTKNPKPSLYGQFFNEQSKTPFTDNHGLFSATFRFAFFISSLEYSSGGFSEYTVISGASSSARKSLIVGPFLTLLQYTTQS